MLVPNVFKLTLRTDGGLQYVHDVVYENELLKEDMTISTVEELPLNVLLSGGLTVNSINEVPSKRTDALIAGVSPKYTCISEPASTFMDEDSPDILTTK